MLRRRGYNLSAYYFTGNAHDLPQFPHGNSKRVTPCKRTKKSALERPKAVCKNNLPSAACAIVEKETGGIVNADSSGYLPCRRQQACDMRRRLFANEDELADIVEQSNLCKKNGEEEIVRCVSLAPEPCITLATDAQMKELERCHQHSVLSVDPPFELGNFYVTPIGFLHLLFKQQRF